MMDHTQQGIYCAGKRFIFIPGKFSFFVFLYNFKPHNESTYYKIKVSFQY